MKPSRDAAALAASLTSAAAAPLPLPGRAPAAVVPPPEPESETPPAERPASRGKKAPAEKKAANDAKEKKATDTVGITLRPPRNLLNRYTLAAAERTRKEGRVVSAQEIMLEVLERGRPQVQS